MGRRKQPKNESGYPDYVIETVARCLFPSILKALKDPETLKEFEEWKKQEKETAKWQEKDF